MARLFQNGSIARADSREAERGDVLVSEEGVIEAVGVDLKPSESVEEIDCAGCVLVPGMFDLHVHAREPGFEHKETIETCAEAAMSGGVTGVVLMPDTMPPVDSGHVLKSIEDLVSERSPIVMKQAGCLTKKRAGETLAGYSGMAARGVPMLTDSNAAVPCPDLLRRCMEYAKDFDLLVTSYCDTPSLSKAGAINEGRVSYRLGIPGIPSISQEIATDRDLRVAQLTGVRLHLQQVSTAHALRAIALAKEEGVSVTCEVSTHHLLLCEDDIPDYNTHYKLDPPLRLSSDREALLAGLIEGTIDIIASNHAPHTEFEKAADFGSAPFGVAGLETAVLAIYDRLIRPGEIGWDLLVKSYSKRPREIIGIDPIRIEKGERAEFFVFDPSGETAITPEALKTKSPVTPFLGTTFAGAIRETVVGGKG
ncbi:MAG: dihydroorotase [Verrucomicrobiota bacterium]